MFLYLINKDLSLNWKQTKSDNYKNRQLSTSFNNIFDQHFKFKSSFINFEKFSSSTYRNFFKLKLNIEVFSKHNNL